MLINWDQPKVVLLVWGMWVLINLVVLIYMNLTLTYRLVNQFQWLSTNVDLRQTTIHPLESRCRPSIHLEVCPTGENGVPNLEPIYGHGGFHKPGIHNSWLVYFMENPRNYPWMVTGGSPRTQETDEYTRNANQPGFFDHGSERMILVKRLKEIRQSI